MQKLFHSILSAKRRYRGIVVGVSLWLLRIVRNIEEEEMRRIEREMTACIWEPDSSSQNSYDSLEEEDTRCDCALGFIGCAVDDLDFAYWGAYGNGKKY